ncbi:MULTISPECIES: helix-turn-helix transcriptional regulator [unclassified Paraburkholderia]|uniref:helix-turn-helix transcriptional regulator n=1 Tax=unclassified Paraburkholderia TaxID=2615204 RepID=UPI002AB7A40A|nr:MULTISPECIES: helix-turn-helix domain-containing protein [unclassified Paraburkholderia]
MAARDMPAGWFEPAIHTSYFHIFARLLEERDLPSPRPPAGLARLLPIIDFLPSFDAILAATRPLSGVEVGMAIPGGAHGPMGMAAISSPTIRDAMEAVVRYVPMRNGLFNYRFAEDDRLVTIQMTPRLDLRAYERFLQYATAVAILNILRAISEPLTLSEGFIGFPWHAPADLGSVHNVMSPCFRFGEAAFSVGFTANAARKPSPTADVDLYRLMTMAGEEELTRISGNVGARIRKLLNAQAPQWPTLEEVASQLAVSKRTLARRLSAENLAYQDLIDEVRSELACWYLRQTSLPIGEIVERTGFSEMSNFSRGFKRLHGISPREYRNRYRSNPAD